MDKAKLKRSGQLLAPSIFTIANMACGFYVLLASHMGDFTAAGVAIVAGVVLDMLDGRIARLVRGESPFGIELDSLSDFLTFCVAPAYMMYALFMKDYGLGGFVIVFIFTLCGALRLARFNAVAHAGTGSKKHFQGLPTPAAAGFLASYTLLYEIIELGSPARTMAFLMGWIPLLAPFVPLIMLLLSFLMVSNVPYAAFKQSDAVGGRNYRLLAILVSFLIAFYFYPQNALFLISLFYVLSGFTRLVFRRRELAPEQAPPAKTS